MYKHNKVKCIDCECCDIRKMKCFPNDPDCESVYDLTKEDLFSLSRCDFFRRKENNKETKVEVFL